MNSQLSYQECLDNSMNYLEEGNLPESLHAAEFASYLLSKTPNGQGIEPLRELVEEYIIGLQAKQVLPSHLEEFSYAPKARIVENIFEQLRKNRKKHKRNY